MVFCLVLLLLLVVPVNFSHTRTDQPPRTSHTHPNINLNTLPTKDSTHITPFSSSATPSWLSLSLTHTHTLTHPHPPTIKTSHHPSLSSKQTPPAAQRVSLRLHFTSWLSCFWLSCLCLFICFPSLPWRLQSNQPHEQDPPSLLVLVLVNWCTSITIACTMRRASVLMQALAATALLISVFVPSVQSQGEGSRSVCMPVCMCMCVFVFVCVCVCVPVCVRGCVFARL